MCWKGSGAAVLLWKHREAEVLLSGRIPGPGLTAAPALRSPTAEVYAGPPSRTRLPTPGLLLLTDSGGREGRRGNSAPRRRQGKGLTAPDVIDGAEVRLPLPQLLFPGHSWRLPLEGCVFYFALDFFFASSWPSDALHQGRRLRGLPMINVSRRGANKAP